MPTVQVEKVQVFDVSGPTTRKLDNEYQLFITDLPDVSFKSKRKAERLRAAIQRVLDNEANKVS